MALQRVQLVREICDVVGKKVAASAVSGTALQDRVAIYLNFAQRRVARAYSASELMKTIIAYTAVGIKTYPLVTGDNNLGMTRVKDIHSIRLDDEENSRTLTCWSQRKFDAVYPRPENFTTQRPTLYTWFGTSLELFRIPDDVYTMNIRYSQWPQELTSDAQVSDYEDIDEVLIAGGVLETYLALEEYTDAKIWEGRFLSLLGAAKATDGDEVNWSPEAEPMGSAMNTPQSGKPWIDPMGDPNDPLYGYAG
jgi:hypothetical protein